MLGRCFITVGRWDVIRELAIVIDCDYNDLSDYKKMIFK